MPDNSDPNAINPVPVTPIFGETPPTEPAPPTLPSMDSDVPPPPEPTGGAGPVGDLQGLGIPPVITPSKPKGRVSRRMVATILGILVLVGGLGAGVVLVQQQQDIREKAAGPGQSCTVSGQTGTCTTGGACTLANKTFKGTSSGGCVSPAGQNIGCCIDCNSGSCYNNCLCRGNSATECRAGCPTASPAATATPTCNSGNCYNDCLCKGNSATECRAACPTATPTCNSGNCYNDCLCKGNTITECGAACPGCYDSCVARGNTPTECRAACPTASPAATSSAQTCRPGWLSGGTNRDAAEEACIGQCGYRNVAAREGNCNWENRGSSTLPNWCYQCTGTGGGTITETATTPPGEGASAQCLAVQAFDSNWTLFTADKLSTLNVGDIVRFAIGGTATTGTNDKAKFKINGVDRSEVTQKRPGTDEYYDEYTVPEGVSSFTIGAQLHNTVLGWF